MEGEDSPPVEPASVSGDTVPPVAPAEEVAIPPPAAPTEQIWPVQFTATAGEYFRIWIVNLALSVITLGIYSAWATVRKRRYFHGHTRIAGDYFEYLGKPVAILKGRIIAVVLFGLYSYSGNISLWLKGGLFLVLAVAAPWLIVRSLAFNAFNTRYRNIRFTFHGTYVEGLKVIAVNGLFAILSVGLLYPSFKARLARFVAGNHAYGSTRFEIGSLTRTFYGIYFKAFLVLVGVFVVIAALVAGMTVISLSLGGKSAQSDPVNMIVSLLPIIIAYSAYLLVYAFLQARTGNATWNAMSLGPVRFNCTLKARSLALLYLGNIFAVLFSIGLATPWAVVRTMRYRADNTRVIATQDLDGFTAGESNPVSATGEEIGDLFGIDISL